MGMYAGVWDMQHDHVFEDLDCIRRRIALSRVLGPEALRNRIADVRYCVADTLFAFARRP